MEIHSLGPAAGWLHMDGAGVTGIHSLPGPGVVAEHLDLAVGSGSEQVDWHI